MAIPNSLSVLGYVVVATICLFAGELAPYVVADGREVSFDGTDRDEDRRIPPQHLDDLRRRHLRFPAHPPAPVGQRRHGLHLAVSLDSC
jgi:hypothetical protein